MRFTPEELSAVAILAGLPDSHISWFGAHGDRIELTPGEHMFEKGAPADFMFIVVSGLIQGYERVGGELLLVATTAPGQVTGMLPFSRMTHYPRYTVAAEPSRVLRVRKGDFPQMLAVSYEVGRRLVAEMSDRVRGDVRLEQLQERMAALGRLSAGLAHELNNPAAAMCRAAAGLSEELSAVSGFVMRFVRHDVRDAHLAAINHLYELATTRTMSTLSPLESSEREDDLGRWLEQREVSRAWDAADAFAAAGLVVADLERFAEDVPDPIRTDAIAWVACRLVLQRFAREMGASSSRISRLVGSVKTYTHMDQSPAHQPTDVRGGLDNTLALLEHKIRGRAIELVRDYADDLPLISANPGQLNQVWSSLVDNAIDAVDEAGAIRIDVRRRDGYVEVMITDDGHGIPPEIQNRVFEPFFTTKDVGQGVGLGLDIALRIVKTHHGSLSLRSEAGLTRARVRLPVPVSGT